MCVRMCVCLCARGCACAYVCASVCICAHRAEEAMRKRHSTTTGKMIERWGGGARGWSGVKLRV